MLTGSVRRGGGQPVEHGYHVLALEAPLHRSRAALPHLQIHTFEGSIVRVFSEG
jgi:hypothetical protein